MMTVKQAIEKTFNRCNLIGEDANIYAEMNRYKALRELTSDQRDKIYDILACRLGFMPYDRMPQVKYFEVAYKNTLAGYTTQTTERYLAKVAELEAEGLELEVVFREWTDGTIENGSDLPDIV